MANDSNMIWRNKSRMRHVPQEVKKAASALTPGMLVKIDSNDKWTPCTSATDLRGRVFAVLEFGALGTGHTSRAVDGANATYAAEAMTPAVRLLPGVLVDLQTSQTGTIAKESQVTCGAAGRLAAAASGSVIILGTVIQAETGVTAGQRIRIEVGLSNVSAS